MNARITFKTKIDDREYKLCIDFDTNYSDVLTRDNKYAVFFGHYVFINEELSDKDYQRVFGISPDGDFHSLVEFKNNPKGIRVVTHCNYYSNPRWQIDVIGE